MKISNLTLTALLASLCLVFSAPAAHADNGAWKKKHPRRAEVLKRDNRLHKRTENAEGKGKINEKQADRLEKQEGEIRRQEQADAAANGGHITKGEQAELNREENRVNKELKRDERRDRRRNRHAGQGATPANPGAPGEGAAPAVPATPPANN